MCLASRWNLDAVHDLGLRRLHSNLLVGTLLGTIGSLELCGLLVAVGCHCTYSLARECRGIIARLTLSYAVLLVGGLRPILVLDHLLSMVYVVARPCSLL